MYMLLVDNIQPQQLHISGICFWILCEYKNNGVVFYRFDVALAFDGSDRKDNWFTAPQHIQHNTGKLNTAKIIGKHSTFSCNSL